MMTDQNPTPITPDFEERHRLALAVLEHLGIDPTQVLIESLTIQLGPDSRHRVSWAGTARLTTEQLDGILTGLRHERAYHDGTVDR